MYNASMNNKQMTLLKEHLAPIYANYAPSTRRNYTNWIIRLVEHVETETGQLVPLRHMQQWQATGFVASLVRPGGCSRSTTNQAARAINIYFDSQGINIHLDTVSTRHRTHHHIDTITPAQVQQVLDNLHPFYRGIAERVYNDLTPPLKACEASPSIRGGAVHPATLNTRVKQAAQEAGINKRVTPTVLRQSGLIHRLQAGQDWRAVAGMAGLEKSTIERYMTGV